MPLQKNSTTPSAIAATPPPKGNCIDVYNKCDVYGFAKNQKGRLYCSALTGEGVTAILDEVYNMFISGGVIDGGLMLTEARHYEALLRADAALRDAEAGGLPELVAEDLREALSAFSEITGESLSETVVDRIFEKFCLGK